MSRILVDIVIPLAEKSSFNNKNSKHFGFEIDCNQTPLLENVLAFQYGNVDILPARVWHIPTGRSLDYGFTVITSDAEHDTNILWPQQEAVQILPSIQFSMEEEDINQLALLDRLITHTENEFKTSIYHKPTFTPTSIPTIHIVYKKRIVKYLKQIQKL